VYHANGIGIIPNASRDLKTISRGSAWKSNNRDYNLNNSGTRMKSIVKIGIGTMKLDRDISKSAKQVFAYQLSEAIQRMYAHGHSGKNAELRAMRKTLARLKRKTA
jgi:hypothetical protein